MPLNKNEIKKILVITLSNLGDVVLTTPAVEVLLREFSGAELDIMVGPNGREIFEKHPGISELIVYDKFMPLAEKLKLISRLRKKRYSLIVDLRNTFLPFLIGAPHKTLPFKKFSKHSEHKKDSHLWKLKALGINITHPPYRLYVSDEDRAYTNSVLKYLPEGRLIAVNVGAKSSLKRWGKEGFTYVINRLKEAGANIVMVGSPQEAEIAADVLKGVKGDVLNLAGKTTVRQLIALLDKIDLLITNDTAPLHMCSILRKKTVALFGPTDHKEYGPFSKGSVALLKPVFCAPCRKAHCAFNHECMQMLKKETVYRVANAILEGREFKTYAPKRILMSRTDRLGDVVLSTPAIKAVHEACPNIFISFMVRPYAKDIVDGNSYLDEVIVFDKKGAHRGVLGAFKLVSILKRRRFDIALILHPTIRVHVAAFLTRIPERIGYNKKMGFLLTKRMPHAKQLGEKHESEYTLDLLRKIGIQADDKTLFVPLNRKAVEAIDNRLRSNGVKKDDIIVGIHPGASCPSKRWLPERFAELADRIIDEFGVKVVVMAGPSDTELGNKVSSLIKRGAINLAGSLSIKELIALLKRCALFISNDSGPVHIAAAVGTPVISIFGRNEKGLSPTRWRPLGKDDIVVHKDVGCRVCLAHNCKIGFKCLKEINTNEIFNAVLKFKNTLKP